MNLFFCYFAGCILYLASLAAAGIIITNLEPDTLLKLLKSGYQVDEETFKRFDEAFASKMGLHPIIAITMFFAPVINVAMAFITTYLYQREFKRSPIIQNGKFPIPEEAKQLWEENIAEIKKRMVRCDSVVPSKTGITIGNEFFDKLNAQGINLVTEKPSSPMEDTKDGDSSSVSKGSDSASIKTPFQTTDTAVLEEGPTLGKKLK